MLNKDPWEPFREQHGPSEAWGVVAVRPDTTRKVIIPASSRLDGQDADLIARGHNARLALGAEGQLYYKAIVSSRTKMPAYQFQFGDASWEWDLRELSQFIEQMYKLREAAVTDSFIYRWVTERLMPAAPAAEQERIMLGLFVEFREFRELLESPVEEVHAGGDADGVQPPPM